LATDDEESNDNAVIVSSRAFVPPCNLQPHVLRNDCKKVDCSRTRHRLHAVCRRRRPEP